ncbi:IS1/IS1595 family N-terminal zinc-binding domain-containing protein [unidentified bacterial endosymbiont]
MQVKCRYCRQERVVKNGKAPNGSQRFYYQGCQRSFPVKYH